MNDPLQFLGALLAAFGLQQGGLLEAPAPGRGFGRFPGGSPGFKPPAFAPQPILGGQPPLGRFRGVAPKQPGTKPPAFAPMPIVNPPRMIPRRGGFVGAPVGRVPFPGPIALDQQTR